MAVHIVLKLMAFKYLLSNGPFENMVCLKHKQIFRLFKHSIPHCLRTMKKAEISACECLGGLPQMLRKIQSEKKELSLGFVSFVYRYLLKPTKKRGNIGGSSLHPVGSFFGECSHLVDFSAIFKA